MFSKRFLLSVGAVAGAAMFSTNAMAGSVLSLMQNGFNTFEDSDREFLVNRVTPTTGPNVGSATSVEVGDSFSGILRFVQSNGGVPDVGITDNSWDVVFKSLVASKTLNLAGGFDFTFVPDPTLKVNGAPAGPGVLGVFYEDAKLTTNLGDGNDNGGTPLTTAAAISTVTDGTRFWSVGFTGAPTAIPALDGLGDWDNSGTVGDAGDTGFLFTTAGVGEGWTSVSTAAGIFAGAPGDNVAPFAGLGQSPTLIDFDTGLSRILNGAIPETGDNILLNKTLTTFGFADFSFEGGVGGTKGLGGTNFDLTSQTVLTFDIERIVPEPITSTMGLMGLGALSMIARRRRIA